MFRSRLRADEGFTLVELLVAVLIVGVLIAVGLASFLNQREKAQDAEAKAAVMTAATAMLAFGTAHGDYASATPRDLVEIERALGQARGLEVESTATTFSVSVESAGEHGAVFSVQHTRTGETVRDCTPAGAGACHSDVDDAGSRW
jgi:prepilin-type N-terminal cleavage/methylation domain-containing protein